MAKLIWCTTQAGKAEGLSREPLFFGWVVVAGTFLTLLLTVGIPFYGLPFFYDHFMHEFGWSRARTTSGIAIATVLVQPLAGLLVHRFSPRKMILFGGAMLLVSLVAFGMGTGSLILYYVAWIFFMTGYVFAGPLPTQIILSQWFSRRRGFAIGCAYLGLGLGGAISQKYVALPLIEHFGWRTALMLIGLSMLLLIPIVAWMIRDRPEDIGLRSDGDTAPSLDVHAPILQFRDILSQRAFWLLALGSFCSIGAIGSINQHMKLLFQDAGLTAATVANTTFTILIASLAGRVAMGWLADFFSKRYIMVMAFLFVALPIPLLLIAGIPGIPLLFALSFGFGLGADYMLIPLMAAETFGPRSLARAMGIILPLDSIAQTSFPFLLGIMRDRTQSYSQGLMVIASLAILGAIAIASLPGRSPVERPMKVLVTQ